MKNSPFLYVIISIFVVVLGILSRKADGIPLFVGDLLYAVMIYFGCRSLFINGCNTFKILLPLIICFLIEIQQLYNAEWLVAIRNTALGHYALGQGFLWSDLVCYSFGVVMAFVTDTFLRIDSNLKSKF